MNIPTLSGVIDRRLLINFQVEADALSRFLPQPFRPRLINGQGMAGICLIRLKNVRPKGMPRGIGIGSENCAHRIAVEWTTNGENKQGVFIPRRDTSSIFNSLVGGRVFPGVHHFAEFNVKEDEGGYAIEVRGKDGTHLFIDGKATTDWNRESVFESLECASEFFRMGSVGYSPDRTGEGFDGLELKTDKWVVSPLAVRKVTSSFFENESVFPKSSVKFDNALLMKTIDHEWESKKKIHPDNVAYKV